VLTHRANKTPSSASTPDDQHHRDGNSFFGYNAGAASLSARTHSLAHPRQPNTSGTFNAFFGYQAGANTTSSNNTFFGHNAGPQIQPGNSFWQAPGPRYTGIGNAFFGHGRLVEHHRHEKLVFIDRTIEQAGTFNSFFGYSAGKITSDCCNSFFGVRAASCDRIYNSFFGYIAGSNNSIGSNNSFFGTSAGLLNTTGQHNTSVGNQAGESNTVGSFNTTIGDSATYNANNLDHATAIGAGSLVNTSNTIALGRPDGSDLVEIYGRFQLDTLGPASNPVCYNGANRIGSCSSSLRYKTQVQPFLGGRTSAGATDQLYRKETACPILGLGAEEVQGSRGWFQIRRDRRRQIHQVSAVSLTVQRQQAQITAQQRTIEQRSSRRSLLQAPKLMVCQRNKREGLQMKTIQLSLHPRSSVLFADFSPARNIA
jgi:hypothetical protein